MDVIRLNYILSIKKEEEKKKTKNKKNDLLEVIKTVKYREFLYLQIVKNKFSLIFETQVNGVNIYILTSVKHFMKCYIFNKLLKKSTPQKSIKWYIISFSISIY